MIADTPESTALRVPPRRHGAWRRASVLAVERTAAWLGGRALYRRRHLAAGRFQVRRERIAAPDLPEALDGFTIVQLSDVHAGSFIGEGDLRDVVARANELEPQLIVFTGDLITRDWREALRVLPDFARLRARHGALGVFGNHDYKGRQEARIASTYAEHGLRFLRNEGVRIVHGDAGLLVVGLEDLEESKRIDLGAARSNGRPGDFELVLCHNPGGAARLAHARCLAILCGHTHGTQIDWPGVRGVGPPHPGTRVRLGDTVVIVNRGLGVIGLPLRVGAPSEIVVVELARGEA